MLFQMLEITDQIALTTPEITPEIAFHTVETTLLIYRMFMDDSDVKKFRKYASDNSTEMFVHSLFPEKFKEIVTQCFLENNESFQKLFNDPDFYQKVQDVMAKELYKALRKEPPQ